LKFEFPKSGKIVDAHPGQLAVYNDKHPIRIVCAGRYFGKSVLGSVLALDWAMNKGLEQQEIYIISKNFSNTKKIYWRLLKQILTEIDKRRIEEYCKENNKTKRQLTELELEEIQIGYKTNEHELSILFPNNNIIYLFTAEKRDNLVGVRMDFVVLDEIAVYKNLDDFYDIAIEANLTPDSQVVFISTPRGFNRFFDFWELGQQENDVYKSWTFRSDESPFVTKEKLERAKKRNPVLFEQEYEAKFKSMDGKAFPDFDRKIHSQEFPIFPDFPLSIGMDFNQTWHCWCMFQSVPKYVIQQYVSLPEDYSFQNEVIICHWEFKNPNCNLQNQMKHLDRFLNEIDWKGNLEMYGDAAGGARSYLASGNNENAWDILFSHYPGANFTYKKQNPTHSDRVSIFNDKVLNVKKEVGLLLNSESCQETIKDIEQAVLKANGKLDKSREGKGIGHLVDSLGYAIYLIGSELVETEAPEFVCL
jgi:hypothetical protein